MKQLEESFASVGRQPPSVWFSQIVTLDDNELQELKRSDDMIPLSRDRPEEADDNINQSGFKFIPEAESKRGVIYDVK